MNFTIDSVVGFDLGGTKSKIWVKGEEEIESTSNQKLSQANEKTILDFLKQQLNNENIKAVGIALPCTMVPHKRDDGTKDRKILATVTKFATLTQEEHEGALKDIAKRWGKKLGKSVFILNDGEAAAIDVFNHPQIQNSKEKLENIMVVTLGTSIGVGFIFNGKPYIGPYPSRASHIILEPNGDWCIGENHKGCWKILAGIGYREKLALNMGFKFEDGDGNIKAADTENIAKIAKNEEDSRNAKAKLYFRFYAENVARGIATIISAIPVECVVIAGGVAEAEEILMAPLNERLQRGDLLDPDLAPLIKVIKVDNFSVAHGAQIYAFEESIKQDNYI